MDNGAMQGGGPGRVIPAPPNGPAAPQAPSQGRGLDAVRDILANAASAEPAGTQPAEPQTNGQTEPGAGAQDPATSQQPDEGAGSPEPSGALSLSALAEKAGVSVDDLFAAELALPDERGNVTLEELKTSYTERARLDERSEQLSQDRMAFEQDQIRSRQELTEVLKLLPELPPEVIQAAQTAHAKALDENLQALVSVKPEWADADVYQRAQADILKAVEPYGFTRTDLDGVLDYRLTLMLDHFAALQKRFAGATERFEEVQNRAAPSGRSGPAPAETKPAANAALIDKAKNGDAQDKLAGVAAILRNNANGN